MNLCADANHAIYFKKKSGFRGKTCFVGVLGRGWGGFKTWLYLKSVTYRDAMPRSIVYQRTARCVLQREPRRPQETAGCTIHPPMCNQTVYRPSTALNGTGLHAYVVMLESLSLFLHARHSCFRSSRATTITVFPKANIFGLHPICQLSVWVR